MAKKKIPVDTNESFDALLARRRDIAKQQNPNISHVYNAIIHNGPRAYKVATIFIIRSQNTGEIKHPTLKIETIRKTKEGWSEDEQHSINFSNENEDEIGKLFDFLSNYGRLERSGQYFIIPLDHLDEYLQNLLQIASHEDKKNLINSLLFQMENNSLVTEALYTFAAQSPAETRLWVSALNLGKYSQNLNVLSQLVETDASEHVFQKLLEDNFWMFGSEYSELIPRRNWTTDERLDFSLRRTIDDCLEIIEIKRSSATLMVYDRSHDIYYPSSGLANAISQVMNYIDKIEKDRHKILADFRIEVSKVKAKLVIGRDGSPAEQAGLRTLNSHLHRIEIITFDQLQKIAERVISLLSKELDSSDMDLDKTIEPDKNEDFLSNFSADDIPF